MPTATAGLHPHHRVARKMCLHPIEKTLNGFAGEGVLTMLYPICVKYLVSPLADSSVHVHPTTHPTRWRGGAGGGTTPPTVRHLGLACHPPGVPHTLPAPLILLLQFHSFEYR
jgi:hypothetical protein